MKIGLLGKNNIPILEQTYVLMYKPIWAVMEVTIGHLKNILGSLILLDSYLKICTSIWFEYIFYIFFGSQRSLRSANVVSVCLSVCIML